MYVLYEHLPDTSLTDHIETHSPMETRLRYLMDIVNGIIFIHCQGVRFKWLDVPSDINVHEIQKC